METIKTRKNLLGRDVTVRKGSNESGAYKVRTVSNPKTGETKIKSKNTRKTTLSNGETLKQRSVGRSNTDAQGGETSRYKMVEKRSGGGNPKSRTVLTNTIKFSPPTEKGFTIESSKNSKRFKQKGEKAVKTSYTSEPLKKNLTR
jgi:hypothetical protein